MFKEVEQTPTRVEQRLQQAHQELIGERIRLKAMTLRRMRHAAKKYAGREREVAEAIISASQLG